jgi:hypothetical protein
VRVFVVTAIAASIALGIASPAQGAIVGGGLKPSEAPLITFGQRYNGELNNHKSDANYDGSRQIALWRLPPVSTRDLVVVNWHSVPFTKGGEGFPVCMALAQNIDDFNWGSRFKETLNYCDDDGPMYELSGSGTAQTSITVQETSPTSTYLEFTASSNTTNSSYFETYPYDFSVEPPRHYLGIAVKPVTQVRANGFLHAALTLADGSPAPDGLPFALTATWANGGIWTTSAATLGGQLGFALALPEAAIGKKATFVISRAADAAYQAVSSPRLIVPVKKPTAVPAGACETARRRSHALARQYNRLQRRAASAHGQRRRALKRRAHRVGKQLRAARTAANAAC